MRTRSIIMGVLALGGIATMLVVWLRPAPIEVEAASATLERFERTVDDEGKTRVRDRYVVSAPVAGRLLRPSVKVGDGIVAGETVLMLVPLDPTLIDRRSFAALRERSLAAQAAHERAELEVARAHTAEQLARSEWMRIADLAQRGFVSASSRDHAQWSLEEREQARRAVDRARDVAAHESAAAQSALQAAGRPPVLRDEEVWRIAAPVSGSVLRLAFDSESPVQAGSPLIEIGDTRSLEVAVEVLSAEAASIRPGQEARLDLGPLHRNITAAVHRIEPVARTRVSALGIDEQRVTVVLAFATALEPSPGDGWRVDVRIVTESHAGALTIPVGALLRDRQGWSVFVVDGSNVRLKPVELGGRGPRRAWIRSGLAPGDQVVVHPPDALQDGVAVRLRRPGR